MYFTHYLFYVSPVLLVVRIKKEQKKDNEKRVSRTQKPTAPNIVFIYLDDLGYGEVCIYGAKGLETLNVDNLITGGV